MKIYDNVEQQSLTWFELRAGKVTPSNMDKLVTPLGKIKTGDGPKTYLMEKLAERWIQGPLPAVQGVWDLEQGQFLEDYARPAFTLETGLPVRKVGFIEGDNPNVGCSPDGLIIGQESGLELKCPHIEKHLRYLLDGVCPPDYVLQVQGSMYVTNYSHWYFCSFRRNAPIFVLDVQRDDEMQETIAEAVTEFIAKLDEAWAKLCDKNGGPPPPRVKTLTTPGPVKFSWEQSENFDLIP